MPLDLHELLALATDLSDQASELLLDGLVRTDLEVDTKSSSTDMVTEIDHAAEALIVAGIHAARPAAGVLGEEGVSEAGSSGVRWVIDPIDGTTNYLYGLPGFGISIAAEVDGEVEVGVVAVPLHRETFTAVRGRGAFRNGNPIAASTETDLDRALVATGFAYDPGRRVRQAEVVTGLIAEVRDVRRIGAASVDLCSVGCGRVDAYFERGLQPWDHAAGALVASEGGARVGDLTGGPAGEDFVLAAPEALWEPLAERLRQLGADAV